VAVTILVTMTPVLWLYGPAGVGKTTVAWELFTQLTREGTPTGYVDIDQLGMCYAAPTRDQWAPEPASDPGRHRMKARNLDAIVANFQGAGARCVVVSGVVDAARGFDVDLIPHAALTPCRLRAAPHELRQRLAGRGRPTDQVDEVLRDADALDRNDLSGACIDTTGRSVADVLRLVRKQIGGWPNLGERDPRVARRRPVPAGTPVGEAAGPSTPYRSPVTGPGEILWLCGATAVGKSAVGWQIYMQVRRAGFRAAFVDLEQIGFYRPVPAGDPGNHRLKASNLAAIWQTFRGRGAHCLIVVGPVERRDAVRTYTAALPAATITLCRLHAGRFHLTERVMLRGQGLGPTWGPLPGDVLTGQPAALLRHVAHQAAADAVALESAAMGDLRIDTDGRGVQDIAEEILLRTGWPDRHGDESGAPPRPTTVG
jgi:AAA domain